MPVPGAELLAGAAISYVVRKLRRAGGRADAAVDRSLDQGVDAVEALVTRKIGQDQALARLRDQAVEGTETERAVRRAVDAVADAIEDDPRFARELKAMVDRLQSREATAGQEGREGGVHAGRDVHQHAETGGVITADIHGSLTVSPPGAGQLSTGPIGGRVDPTWPVSGTWTRPVPSRPTVMLPLEA